MTRFLMQCGTGSRDPRRATAAAAGIAEKLQLEMADNDEDFAKIKGVVRAIVFGGESLLTLDRS